MLAGANGKSRVESVADAVRKRICLAEPGRDMVLHEGALASEFHMSRTPVRQVLQRLAYERLVETRSGIGTIAVALDEAHRDRYLRVHQGILRAVVAAQQAMLDMRQKSQILALAGLLEQQPTSDAEFHFEIRSQLIAVLADVIEDPILRDAHLASHWRVVRCDMRDYLRDADNAARRLKMLIDAVAQAVGKDLLFQALLEHDLQA